MTTSLADRAAQLRQKQLRSWNTESGLLALAQLVTELAREVETLRGDNRPRPAGADTPLYAGTVAQ